MTLAYDALDAADVAPLEAAPGDAARPGSATIPLGIALVLLVLMTVFLPFIREIVAGLVTVAVVWSVSYLAIHAVMGEPTPR